MKLKAIFNRDGGTFRTTDMEDYTAKVTQVFHDAGHEIEVAVVAGKEMEGVLEKTARRDDLDAMIAGGGDGTISGGGGRCLEIGHSARHRAGRHDESLCPLSQASS